MNSTIFSILLDDTVAFYGSGFKTWPEAKTKKEHHVKGQRSFFYSKTWGKKNREILTSTILN